MKIFDSSTWVMIVVSFVPEWVVSAVLYYSAPVLFEQ